MKYAHQLSDMFNAFSPEPLKTEQMEAFYCPDTIEYRTSDKYSSPIDDIFDISQEAEQHAAVLFMGHRGCGKSTELNRLSDRFRANGYPVKTVICSMDLDLLNIAYSDLLILMADALLEMAASLDCAISTDTLVRMKEFWSTGTQVKTTQQTNAFSLDGGASAKTPAILRDVLNVFLTIKGNMKFNAEIKTEYRSKIRLHISEWMDLLRDITWEITQKTNGKHPIILFEDSAFY